MRTPHPRGTHRSRDCWNGWGCSHRKYSECLDILKNIFNPRRPLHYSINYTVYITLKDHLNNCPWEGFWSGPSGRIWPLSGCSLHPLNSNRKVRLSTWLQHLFLNSFPALRTRRFFLKPFVNTVWMEKVFARKLNDFWWCHLTKNWDAFF